MIVQIQEYQLSNRKPNPRDKNYTQIKKAVPTFIKMAGIVIAVLFRFGVVAQENALAPLPNGKETNALVIESNPKNHLIEELRPRQIMEVVSKSSMIFIPVSPVFEWHSYHLPMATDAIIAEEVSKIFAEHFNGLYFSVLPVSLEEWRNQKFLTQFGVPDTTKMYGMDFPGLPVSGEYHHSGPPFLRLAVDARLSAVKNSGFRYAFLLNCHGGKGQSETLDSIVKEWTTNDFKVFSVFPNRFNTYKPDKDHELYLKAGAHAGIRETHFLMAFRPDLVDLNEIPEGDLKAAEYGIFHSSPVIPDSLSPKHAMESISKEVRKSILENGIKYIESCVLSNTAN